MLVMPKHRTWPTDVHTKCWGWGVIGGEEAGQGGSDWA